MDEICNDLELPEQGRQTALGRKFGVTPKAARRWLVGEGFPETELAVQIAREARVHFEWLMTGRGPKRLAPIRTGALVISEALESLEPSQRHEVLEYFRYRVEKSQSLFTAERLKDYIRASEELEADKKPAQ